MEGNLFMKIKKIEKIHLETPIPVYDLTVANKNHNFALAVDNGMSIYAHNCDEINEKGVEEAINLLNSIDNRFSSRFQGSPLVFQSVVSSARTTNSPIGEYIRKLPKNDPSILILAPKLWEVKEDPEFLGDGSTFPVLVGNGSIPSKIFTDPGELKALEDGNYEPPAGCEVINVPTVYKEKFELQLEQSIQDIAGMTTVDNSTVFRDISKLEDSELPPEFNIKADINDNNDILATLDEYNLWEKLTNGRYMFKRAPNAIRYCLKGDTKVSLLDGNEKTLIELENDYKNGIDNWVYSWHESGWQIGKIVFAGKTSETTKLYKITLDNNEIVECTDNHKFLMRNNTYLQAKDLKPDMSLMPLYRNKSKICSYKAKTYEKIFDNNTHKWIFTHKISANVLKENYDTAKKLAKEKNTFVVRHHKDFNAANNNPTNLMFLDNDTHFELHSKRGTDHFTKLWQNPEFRKKQAIVQSKNGKINGRKDMMKKWHGENNQAWREYLRPIQVENGRKCFIKYNKSEKHRDTARTILTEARKNQEFNRKILIGRIKKTISALIENNIPVSEEYWDTLDRKKYYNKITLKTALKLMGSFENIVALQNEVNHKIKKIEIIELENPIPMYNLTVEDPLNCHNFALSSGVVVSNCHVDLARGGDGGHCDAGICIGHKEWQYNEEKKENETIYVVDLLLAINAKNKIDIHAIETFLMDLVMERNMPIRTVSSDQWNGEIFLQTMEKSGCFEDVQKLSVDVKLEPYTNAATLIELGQVKVGTCPKLKKELSALVFDKGKVTRTTELKDLADVLVGMIYNAQLNYADFPQYEYITAKQAKEKINDYSNFIDQSSEELFDLI